MAEIKKAVQYAESDILTTLQVAAVLKVSKDVIYRMVGSQARFPYWLLKDWIEGQNGCSVKKTTILGSSDDFCERMQKLAEEPDPVIRHCFGDQLLCLMLKQLGYTDGVTVFETMSKGY